MFALLALATAALGATPAAADAQGFQSTAVLDAIVAQFTGAPIGATGGARAGVDKRLKLQACPAPQLEWRNEAKDAVIVRCMSPVWRIFVPVNGLAQPKPEPVAQRPAPAAKVEPVIRRGDLVTLEAATGGFSITRDGTAMNDAAPGARVAVKVDDRKPPVQGIALEPGRARLPGFDN